MGSMTKLDDARLEQHRVKMIEKHTARLRPGWYVANGFFWHDACTVIAGPFSTQEDAMLGRTIIENYEGHHQYYVDKVEPS